MVYEYKSFNCEIKADGEGMIEGYGAYFNNTDSHRDKIQKGAFSKTIKENRDRIKLLWQHNMYEPIGKMTDMYEDEKGLYIKAKVSNTDTGKKAMELVRDGVLNEMSIGYETMKDDYDMGKNIRTLKEIKLYEVSIVTLASNPMAQITAYKGLNNKLYEDIETITNELKAGRVISKRNMQMIKEAITMLNSLIEAFEPSNDTQKQAIKPNEIDYQYILNEIKKYQNS